MNKARPFVLWLTLAVFTSVLLVVVFNLIYELKKERGQTEMLARMLSSQFYCPDSTIFVFSGWGEFGYSKSCVSSGASGIVKNGPWEGWEAGRLILRGSYSKGKEVGRWEVRTSKGGTECELAYESGILKSSKGECDRWISR